METTWNHSEACHFCQRELHPKAIVCLCGAEKKFGAKDWVVGRYLFFVFAIFAFIGFSLVHRSNTFLQNDNTVFSLCFGAFLGIAGVVGVVWGLKHHFRNDVRWVRVSRT